MNLRDYQQECLQAHFDFFDSHPEGNPLFVLPTGAGKSLAQAAFLKTVFAHYPDERILLLTHVKELIEQNYARLKALWPEAPAGIYSAGLKSRELDRPITFAGIQSFHKVAGKLPPPSLVLIDEAHLCGKDDGTMYRTTLDTLTAANPDLRIIGYTATPYRLAGGLLHKGEGRIFTHVAYDLPVKRLIAQGHLCRPIVKHVECIIDTTGIASRGGDFVQGDLARRVEQDLEAVEASVDEAVKLSREQKRRHWLIFACSIAHAEMIYGKLNGLGVPARFVHGGTPSEDRAEFVRQAKAGEITALINVGVFTTGFDWPACDALWLMRPTQSTGLYVQMMGRGLRTSPGKENCLVLDYGENIERHGPIDAVSPKNAGDPKRFKTCPECSSEVPVKLETCPDCGADLRRKACKTCRATMPIAATVCPECESDPDEEPMRGGLETVARVTREASTAEALSSGEPPQPKWLAVDDISFSLWKKPGRPDSVRVRYSLGLDWGFRQVSEWLCPEHGGFATAKFRQEWVKLGGSLPHPTTTEEALDRSAELRLPKAILVAQEGKYERVVERDMTPRAVFSEDDVPF